MLGRNTFARCRVLVAVIMIGLLVAATGAVARPLVGGAAGPSFSAPVFSRVSGTFVNDLATADLNGDGKADLVTVAVHPAELSVLLGRGDGSFWRRVSYRSDAVVKPANLEAADVNGDGRPDLIVANHEHPGSVAVLLNDGAGRFDRGEVYPSGPAPNDVEAADVNGDGFLDLLTASKTRRDLSVLLGTGAGRFALPLEFTADTGARRLAVGDLNGDGKLDVALSQWGVEDGERLVAVRLGNGDGTFGPANAFGPRAGPSLDVALADVNNDGNLDIALPDAIEGVALFLGNGDATFGAASRVRIGDGPFAVVLADFDADGNVDLATSPDGDELAVRGGRGDGTFGKQQLWPASNAFGSLAVADFSGDGRPDLAVPAVFLPAGEGADVFLNWSGRPAPPCVVVPVIGKRMRAAKREINNAGCRMGHVRYRYSRAVREKRVISQRPRYGTVLPSRRRVDIVISQGKR